MHNRGDISTELFIYRILKDALYDRMLAPGTALTERSICDAYQVGRTPLRAALRRLADEGFVEIVPNRGAFVVTTTREQLTMLYDARTELNMVAVRRGIGTYTEEDFSALEKSIDNETQAAQKLEFNRYLECIDEFFSYIMEKGNNPILTELYKSLFNKTRILLVLYDEFYTPVSLFDSCQSHSQMVKAIRDQDVDKVEKVLREHCERVVSKIRFNSTATAKVDIALKYKKLEE